MVRRLLACAAIATLTAAACGGGDDDGGSESSDSALMTLLGAIPDTPEAASYVGYSGLDAYYDALGVGSPPGGASAAEFDEWLGDLSEAEQGDVAPLLASAEFALDALRDTEAFRAEIGVDPANIRQSIEAGEPPEMYTVLRGDFDSGDIGDAVANDENFADLLTDATHSGVAYYTWGEGLGQDCARNSPVHSLERGGRLALHDDLLMWCFWTDGMTGMIDATIDADDSLADRDDFSGMASAIETLPVYWVSLTTETTATASSPVPLLSPFEAYAVAGGTDDDGPFLAIALANTDEATATENAGRIVERFEAASEQGESYRWAQGVETVEASVIGTVTLAVLRGEALPWNFVVDDAETLQHEVGG